MFCNRPGPSSTERGLPVRATGSPTVTPAIFNMSYVSSVDERVKTAGDSCFWGCRFGRTGFLVYLDGSLVGADSNDFTD